MPLPRRVVATGALLLGLGSGLRAQAVVRGTVVAAESGLALELAEIQIDELDARTTTGAGGQFRLAGIPLGVFTLRVRRIGFQSAIATLRIEALDSVTVRLPMTAWIPTLETVLVSAKATAGREVEIAERHAGGFGTLIRHDQLRSQDHLRLEDILRRAGVRIAYDRRNHAVPVSPRFRRLTASGADACPMTVLLDGITVTEDLGRFPVQALGTVEIFKSAAEAPAQYGGLGRACGVILLWTRER